MRRTGKRSDEPAMASVAGSTTGICKAALTRSPSACRGPDSLLSSLDERVPARAQQRALVDAEAIGQPVGDQLLADGRIVVLSMLGAGLLRLDDAQRDVDALRLRIVVRAARLRDRKGVK